MKFLVTGGGGFIGSNLALSLEKEGYTEIVLDDFSKGDAENLFSFRGEVVSDSILTVELSRFEDVDAIFHCAAITDTTVEDEELMTEVNVDGFKRFLEFAVNPVRKGFSNGVKRDRRFIYSSSAAVYGNASGLLSEDTAGNPLNLYGKSKWKDDCIAMDYIKQSESFIVGLRYFNVFGKGERFKGKMASMVWQLAQQMKAGKRPRIFKWGEQRRDRVYVKDIVHANILALNARRSAIVNVGTGRAVSFNHIIEVLNEVLGTKLEPEYFDNPYEDVYQNHTQADLTLAKEVLGYTPEWSFEDAVRDYLTNST